MISWLLFFLGLGGMALLTIPRGTPGRGDGRARLAGVLSIVLVIGAFITAIWSRGLERGSLEAIAGLITAAAIVLLLGLRPTWLRAALPVAAALTTIKVATLLA